MNNNLHEEQVLVTDIKKTQKDISKETTLLAASAVAVGIGTLGLAILGKDMLEYLSLDNSLTFANYMTVKFKGGLVAFSAAAIIAGIMGVVSKTKELSALKKKLNNYKEKLTEIRRSESEEEKDLKSEEPKVNVRTR